MEDKENPGIYNRILKVSDISENDKNIATAVTLHYNELTRNKLLLTLSWRDWIEVQGYHMLKKINACIGTIAFDYTECSGLRKGTQRMIKNSLNYIKTKRAQTSSKTDSEDSYTKTNSTKSSNITLISSSLPSL